MMEVSAPEVLRRVEKKDEFLWHLPDLSCKPVNLHVVFYEYDKSIVTISSNAFTDRTLSRSQSCELGANLGISASEMRFRIADPSAFISMTSVELAPGAR